MPGCAGQAVAAEELVDAFVPREQFVQEAEELLKGAIEVQQDLEKGVQSGYKPLHTSRHIWFTCLTSSVCIHETYQYVNAKTTPAQCCYMSATLMQCLHGPSSA